MRILLDENLDRALRRLLEPHEVVTVTWLGWAGLKNGELLDAERKISKREANDPRAPARPL